MPLEELNIEKCLGIIGSTDARDVPLDYGYYAENIDVSSRYGAIVGAPKDVEYTTTSAADMEGSMVQPVGVDRNVVILDSVSSEVRVRTISTTPGTGVSVPASWTDETGVANDGEGVYGMISESDSVRIGMGNDGSSPAQWVGRIWYYQTDQGTNPTPGNWYMEDAELVGDGYAGANFGHDTTHHIKLFTPDLVISENTDGGNTYLKYAFSQNVNLPFGAHSYHASFIFDGTQEGPLFHIADIDTGSVQCWIRDSTDLGYRAAIRSTNGFYFYNDTNFPCPATWDASGIWDWFNVMTVDSATATHTTLNATTDAGLAHSMAFFCGVMKTSTSGYSGVGYNNPYITTSGTDIIGADSGDRVYFESNLDLLRGYAKHEFPIFIRYSVAGAEGPELPKRATALRVYRKSKILVGYADGAGVFEEHPMMFVQEFDLTRTASGSSFSTTEGQPGEEPAITDTWDYTGTFYTVLTVVDEGPIDSTITYEGNTGIHHSVSSFHVDYGLSAMVDGYHFVGKPHVDELPGGIDTWLFRSKPWKVDTFDWTKDIVILPAEPLALMGFNGRLYAFCGNVTYVIDAYNLEIIETWSGIGAISSHSIISTEKGMFWGDSSTMYIHDGTRAWPIGDTVRHIHDVYGTTVNDVGWVQRDASFKPRALFIPSMNSYLMIYKVSTEYIGLLYNVDHKSWVVIRDFGELGSSKAVQNVFSLSDGTPFVSIYDTAATPSARVKLFEPLTASAKYPTTSTTDPRRRKWKWVSRNLANGSLKSRFYKLRLGMMNLPSDEDSMTSSASFNSTDAAYMPEVKYVDDVSYDSVTTCYMSDGDIDTGGDTVAEFDLKASAGTARKYFRNFGLMIADKGGTDTGTVRNNVISNIAVVLRRLSAR